MSLEKYKVGTLQNKEKKMKVGTLIKDEGSYLDKIIVFCKVPTLYFSWDAWGLFFEITEDTSKLPYPIIRY